MAKSFEEHEWEIEIDGGSIQMRAKDECPDPAHTRDCAISKFYSLLTNQRPRKLTIAGDMGTGIYIQYDNSLDIPDCDCEAAGHAPCICHHIGEMTECLSVKFDVLGKYHYSYDAYSGEADAWLEITEAKLSA